MNVPFEGPGYIFDWMEESGHDMQVWKMYENRSLPETGDVDMLVVMGGPMNINEDERYPFLVGEKYLIRSCIRQQKHVLGICLGAQLIADALGMKVFRNREKEIGWFPVHAREGNRDHYLCSVIPERFIPFHWHGETYDLPQGAILLGSSEACLNQGFLYGDHVLALQFHLEITPQIIEGLLKHASKDMTAGPYIQSVAEVRGGLGNCPANKAILYRLLERFTLQMINN